MHIGNINPYRYRSYYYDTETKLYYLQSRYYDSEVGRFINADMPEILLAYIDTLEEKNLFAYCGNNPVNTSDPLGLISFQSLLEKFVSIKKGEIRIHTGLLGGVIDVFFALMIIICPPLLAFFGKFLGVKMMGKTIGKKFTEKLLKNGISKVAKFFITALGILIGFAVNLAIGFVGKLIFQIIWATTSIGNLIAFLLDALDGKIDGYYTITN